MLGYGQFRCLHVPPKHALRPPLLCRICDLRYLRAYETARILPNPDGTQPTYYRSCGAWYESAETKQALMASSQRQATVADLANFASGGVTIMASQID